MQVTNQALSASGPGADPKVTHRAQLILLYSGGAGSRCL